ncbi:MAG: sugar ABC transporter permease, partial [Candidatus Omnitrophica bacterium CG12_big_fil_rev_8_21_14_0_65_50_5]
HAAYITILALTLQNALAFGLALACDQKIKFRNVYHIIFFIPPVLSEIVVGLIWTWILYSGMQGGQHIGFLNYMFHAVGLDSWIHSWLSDPKTALTCIAVVHCWKGFGWGFVMLLAGLQTIDKQLYEVAEIDGAGWWGTFWNVTIPMMMPVILVVVILTILGSMQAFVLILAMVSQGLVNHTDVPVTRILSSMTETNQFGYACAQGIIFALILITVSFGMKIISSRVKPA